MMHKVIYAAHIKPPPIEAIQRLRYAFERAYLPFDMIIILEAELHTASRSTLDFAAFMADCDNMTLLDMARHIIMLAMVSAGLEVLACQMSERRRAVD